MIICLRYIEDEKTNVKLAFFTQKKIMLAYILFWWIQIEQTNVVLWLLYENRPSYKKIDV